MRRPSRPTAALAAALAAFVALAGCVTQPAQSAPPAGPAAGASASAGPDADAALAADSLRRPLTQERFYFVVTDRFANGDPGNDTGGLTGDRLVTGFDPTDKGFYHGGDLKGLTGKLDYIKGLGTTAIWLTPAFVNKPVQGPPGQESAGYHGYWITDFTRIDPHLGTNDEMKALITAAHDKGMKVFFDIITNHTADVIDNAQGVYTYQDKRTAPYKDASGRPFDDRDYVGREFPPLNASSFPYTPMLRPGDEKAKTPAWLNDPTMYHNRGNSTFAGESSTYGDFVGLDDLFTERPEVVAGMGEIYAAWVDLGIDGFRIDTVKHVNLEFWQQFAPTLLDHAAKTGNDDFFAFGEVYDGNPAVMSQYTTTGRLQATLDFGFQARAADFAKGRGAQALAQLFADDDQYTDADSNAYQLPTFLGNHDMGRLAMLLQQGIVDDGELMARMKLAYGLMYVVRGNPVVYSGDEQGFLGMGGDKDARQDLFASQVPSYNNEAVLGGASGSRDRYDTAAPLYTFIKDLAALRAAHPALADGAQQNRFAAPDAGMVAFSRYDRRTGTEYLVAANNATTPASASFATWTRDADFQPVYGTDAAVRSGADRTVGVTVPPLSVAVWHATKKVDADGPAPTVSLKMPEDLKGRAEIGADVASGTFAQATFWYRPAGSGEWRLVGTDDSAPFRMFHDTSVDPATELEYRVVVKDAAGRVASATGRASKPAAASTPPGGAVTAETVTLPGTHGPAIGCSAEWDPACPQGALAKQADGRWTLTVAIPPGTYQYKVAVGGSWSENYGEGGAKDGANLSFTVPAGAATTTFVYDPATHLVAVTSG